MVRRMGREDEQQAGRLATCNDHRARGEILSREPILKGRVILSGVPGGRRWGNAVEGSRRSDDVLRVNEPPGSFDCAAPAFPPPLRSG